MQLRKLNGKQGGFHSAFNYLYQPIGMNGRLLHSYYCDTKFIKKLEADKLEIEYFEYTEQHLFYQHEAVIYRTTEAVPTFPWTWICSTRSFLTSILDIIDKDDPDHQKEEEYAFCFLILFVPFRSREDLETDNCYKSTLQRAHREDRINKE